jgi:hypothetical protein
VSTDLGSILSPLHRVIRKRFQCSPNALEICVSFSIKIRSRLSSRNHENSPDAGSLQFVAAEKGDHCNLTFGQILLGHSPPHYALVARLDQAIYSMDLEARIVCRVIPETREAVPETTTSGRPLATLTVAPRQ